VVLALAALAGALMPSATSGKLLYALAALALFCALGWLVLLDESERSRARHPLALLSGSPPR
jgi:hypothetical protein